jgi:hypothetical protein
MCAGADQRAGVGITLQATRVPAAVKEGMQMT